MTNGPDHYAVFGNPIAHSKSPLIHTLFARQTEQNMEYTAELAELDQFAPAVNNFIAMGGKGINVTVPFKLDAWKFATEKSSRAELAGAVNTLIFESDGNIYGENTDGVGLVNDLILNHGLELENKSILIIGAGGAVRGIIEPLLEQKPGKLLIANRTKEKALELAEDFSKPGNINGCGLDELEERSFDVIINGTSASLKSELPELPANIINSTTCCYDLMYATEPTPFMQWANSIGANKVLDGLGMLVEQAAESFYLWRGIKPETHMVIETVRKSLNKS